jgi:ABC-type lipoprotein export system ATPase subunit
MMPLLSFADVGKSFWRGTVRVEALRGVSLELAPGDFVAVWGSLGSGKSTLLRVAAGLDAPDEGEVRIDGRLLAELSRRDLKVLRRHEVGIADRSGPHERELTALDYIAFPLMGTMRRAEASRRAMAALRQLGLEPACGTLQWRELTDGERTLVSIAHAIVRRPKLLLVDDPTSSLGLHERERTVALLHRFASEQGMAVLMTAPDSAATLGAHEVFTLSGGALLPAGPVPGGDLIRLPGA